MQRFILLCAAVWLGVAGAASAQLRGVKADVTPIVEADGAHAGADARVALQVALPDDDAMARFTFDVAHWCGQRIEGGSWIMRPFHRIAEERP